MSRYNDNSVSYWASRLTPLQVRLLRAIRARRHELLRPTLRVDWISRGWIFRRNGCESWPLYMTDSWCMTEVAGTILALAEVRRSPENVPASAPTSMPEATEAETAKGKEK